MENYFEGVEKSEPERNPPVHGGYFSLTRFSTLSYSDCSKVGNLGAKPAYVVL
jgi:hypothetical protein